MRATLPTQLERDTLLTPEWVAESGGREAESFLKAGRPADLVERLGAKACRARHRREALFQPIFHRAFRGEL